MIMAVIIIAMVGVSVYAARDCLYHYGAVRDRPCAWRLCCGAGGDATQSALGAVFDLAVHNQLSTS